MADTLDNTDRADIERIASDAEQPHHNRIIAHVLLQLLNLLAAGKVKAIFSTTPQPQTIREHLLPALFYDYGDATYDRSERITKPVSTSGELFTFRVHAVIPPTDDSGDELVFRMSNMHNEIKKITLGLENAGNLPSTKKTSTRACRLGNLRSFVSRPKHIGIMLFNLEFDIIQRRIA